MTIFLKEGYFLQELDGRKHPKTHIKMTNFLKEIPHGGISFRKSL
jgi:hypothetical protein